MTMGVSPEMMLRGTTQRSGEQGMRVTHQRLKLLVLHMEWERNLVLACLTE